MSIVDGWTLNNHVTAENLAKEAEHICDRLAEIALKIDSLTNVLNAQDPSESKCWEIDDLRGDGLDEVQSFFVKSRDDIREVIETWTESNAA